LSFYSPVFLSPSASEEIIASADNDFIWETSGTEAQEYYNVFIRKVSDNIVVYDSGKITSALEEHTIPASTTTAGIQYKWQLYSYNTISEYTESAWETFLAIGSPTLVLSATPTVEQNFEFSSVYNHPDDIYVRIYWYELFLGTDLVTPISESGEIYPDVLTKDSSNPLLYTFEGMSSGVEYGVKCTTQDQNNYEVDTGIITFTSTYSIPQATDYLEITALNDVGAIQLEWGNLKQVTGVTTGVFEYLAGFEHDDTTIGAQVEEYISAEIAVDPTGYARISTLSVDATIATGTHLEYYVRYTSDGITWSAWAEESNNSNIESIVGKWIEKIQYKFVLIGEY